MLAALRNNEVDFAIGSMLDLPDDINYRPVYSFATSLITPLDHPLAAKSDITLEDLASDALILPPRHLTTWRLVNLVLQQQNIPYQVRLEVGGWEIMKAYVERGFGIGIASNICLTGREQLAVRPLPEVFPRRTYGVMWRRGKFLSQTARRFIELMDPNFFTAGQDQRFDINHEPSGNQVFVAASGAPSRRETSVAEDTAPLDKPAKPG
jgi:DNA-binding transcriptional LysR family regulator